MLTTFLILPTTTAQFTNSKISNYLTDELFHTTRGCGPINRWICDLHDRYLVLKWSQFMIRRSADLNRVHSWNSCGISWSACTAVKSIKKWIWKQVMQSRFPAEMFRVSPWWRKKKSTLDPVSPEKKFPKCRFLVDNSRFLLPISKKVSNRIYSGLYLLSKLCFTIFS